MKLYTYAVSGSGGDGTFLVEGTIESHFDNVFQRVMQLAFQQLTHGEAVYGNPGKGGCRGPYDIHRLVIAQVIH